jgi:hypothetical protein
MGKAGKLEKGIVQERRACPERSRMGPRRRRKGPKRKLPPSSATLSILRFERVSHNRLWLSFAHTFGYRIETFGSVTHREGGPLTLRYGHAQPIPPAHHDKDRVF